jgi:hypothetical protein
MPNYQNGKVYGIRSRSRPELIYVGSTTQPLSIRFGKHKRPNNTTSKQIIDIGDAYIELIENYSCNSREELLKREGEIIRSMECVNKYISGRTLQEYYQDNKEVLLEKHRQYRIDNAEKIKEKQRQYYIDNKEVLLEKKRQYITDNADIINEKKRQYYIDNKEVLLEKRRQYRIDNAEKIKEQRKKNYEKNRVK